MLRDPHPQGVCDGPSVSSELITAAQASPDLPSAMLRSQPPQQWPDIDADQDLAGYKLDEYAPRVGDRCDGRPLALGYVRASTTKQVDEGASLQTQERLIRQAAEARGWDIEIVVEQARSAGSLRGRPALLEALERLDRGQAHALLALRLDRISRSVRDLADMLDRARRKGWSLVTVEADVDTSTPSGEFLWNVLGSAAQFERRLIGARTKEGLAQRRLEGVRLGRPPVLPEVTVRLISNLRAQGWSYARVAQHLNATGVPTAHGGRCWYRATVRRVALGQTAQSLAS